MRASCYPELLADQDRVQTDDRLARLQLCHAHSMTNPFRPYATSGWSWRRYLRWFLLWRSSTRTERLWSS
jgi:hypothetical protein